MALVSLLKMPTDDRARAAFAFDHDQQHRALGNFPYLLDPVTPTAAPPRATSWHQNHQRAHIDMTLNFASNIFNPNLMDSDLSDNKSLAWWTFLNHQEHRIATRLP